MPALHCPDLQSTDWQTAALVKHVCSAKSTSAGVAQVSLGGCGADTAALLLSPLLLLLSPLNNELQALSCAAKRQPAVLHKCTVRPVNYSTACCLHCILLLSGITVPGLLQMMMTQLQASPLQTALSLTTCTTPGAVMKTAAGFVTSWGPQAPPALQRHPTLHSKAPLCSGVTAGARCMLLPQ